MAGSTLRATAVKCPECGATLAIPEGDTSARCTYCGTPSRVQRRTQFFQLPVRLPPPRDHEPMRIAQQPRSKGGIVALVVVPIVVPILALAGVLVATHVITGSTNWDSRGAPLAIDVDGDGDEDFVGWDRSINPDEMHLAAYSGKDGHTLWDTASLGDFASMQQGPIAAVGKRVLVGDSKIGLRAFDLATGSAAWSVAASEAVDLICAGEADHANIVTKDNKLWSVALADGAIKPATGAPCRWGDWRDMDNAMERSSYQVDGMAVTGQHPVGGGGTLGLGQKSPGTPVPMIAMFEHGTKLAWAAQVPGHDPTTASGEPVAGASEHAIAVAYGRGGTEAPELTLFDRATGKRAWEIVVDKSFMNVLSGVTITKTAVALSLWGSLHVFDLDTGKHRFTIGS